MNAVIALCTRDRRWRLNLQVDEIKIPKQTSTGEKLQNISFPTERIKSLEDVKMKW
jgi:hypothetical protein